jgi:hypothetical protein
MVTSSKSAGQLRYRRHHDRRYGMNGKCRSRNGERRLSDMAGLLKLSRQSAVREMLAGLDGGLRESKVKVALR